jgi:uncharacterized protein (TIGR02217 family)
MNQHHEINIPQFIEAFVIGKSEFSTEIFETISGRNARIALRNQNYQKYIIKNCKLNQEQFDEFNNFFHGRKGQEFSFRMKDLANYKVLKQFIAIGDGRTKEYQLFKIYKDKINPYKKIITKLTENSVKAYINNSLVVSKIQYDTGIITLTENLQQGSILSVDFEFDVQVRFTQNSFEYNHSPDGSIALSEIHLIEVIA